jgi:hypothetical protein
MFSKSEKCFEPLLYQQNESHDLTKKALELPSSTATPQPSTFNIHMLCQSILKTTSCGASKPVTASLAGEMPRHPMSSWIDEEHRGVRYGLKGEVLVEETSPFQRISVIRSER